MTLVLLSNEHGNTSRPNNRFIKELFPAPVSPEKTIHQEKIKISKSRNISSFTGFKGIYLYPTTLHILRGMVPIFYL
jgi:hypothetical protein